MLKEKEVLIVIYNPMCVVQKFIYCHMFWQVGPGREIQTSESPTLHIY